MGAQRTADILYDCVMMDLWPSIATCTDYGISSDAAYRAYKAAVRNDGVTADQLYEAVKADVPGEALTELLRKCPSVDNNIVITTMWDDMAEEEPDETEEDV